MTDEEKDFWERYLKPQYSFLKRIKRKIFGPEKRVKTIDDIVTLDYDFFIKLLCIIMMIAIIRMVGLALRDIYQWFYPPAEKIINPDPFFRQILYSLRGLIYS